MIGNITADRIANSIIQRKKQYENFILVEGTHDRLFLLKFKNADTQVEITFGWEKLIDVLTILKARGYNKTIGIIDQDLREIIPEESISNDDIIITDHHDINIVCLEESFNTIFQSYCSEEKVKTFKAEKNVPCIKEYTYNLVKPLSFLKILNKRESLNLTFKSNDAKKNKLDYSKFIDKNKYELISLDKLVETITNFSRNKTQQKIIADNIILEKLNIILNNENYENAKLSSGHDFGEIVCVGLKKTLGTKEIDSEIFLKENILSYDSTAFVNTLIYKKIKTREAVQGTQYLKSIN